eukprot:CAMPEP_0170397644 /NCGR_PEP_ID=MMETSP0117_2-20130122/22984_1 /TAXON_ID=400756 /ORGANISM="Durinskia baltica, Strain CSIRO CS-38" /LENGTH=743 /DNA_ID=CAMNT_0010654159 /DNA_START=14 /DNA_END=2245 /DNA_ORIENTATION=-
MATMLSSASMQRKMLSKLCYKNVFFGTALRPAVGSRFNILSRAWLSQTPTSAQPATSKAKPEMGIYKQKAATALAQTQFKRANIEQNAETPLKNGLGASIGKSAHLPQLKPKPRIVGALERAHKVEIVKNRQLSPIDAAIQQFRYDKLKFSSVTVKALYEASCSDAKLDAQGLMLGIEACAICDKEDRALQAATWAFAKLQQSNVVGIHTYEKMMAVYSRFKHLWGAERLLNAFIKNGYSLNSSMLSPYIITAARMGRDNQLEEATEHFKALKELAAEKGFVIGPRVFIALAERYCKMGKTDQVLSVLQDLTDSGHEPSPMLCETLLDVATANCDAAVLRVLVNWYKVNFNVGLLDGQLAQILEVAANCGDTELAVAAFQMIKETGLEPTNLNYYCLLRVLLTKGDVVSATEVLQEMENQGVDCFSIGEQAVTRPLNGLPEKYAVREGDFDHGRYLAIKDLIVTAMAGPKGPAVPGSTSMESAHRIDSLYFALVEQVRAARSAASESNTDTNTGSCNSSNSSNSSDGGGLEPTRSATVPVVLLNALIESAGRLGNSNRAFTIFQECPTLFGINPNIHTYNSLLAACAESKTKLTALLNVFQEIEATCLQQQDVGYKAGVHSFGLLIQGSIARKEMTFLGQVMEHMLSTGYMVDGRALRFAVISLALRGCEQDWALVEKFKGVHAAIRIGLDPSTLTEEELMALVTTIPPTQTQLPAVFLKRLEVIKEGQKKLNNKGGGRGVEE